MKKVPMGYLIDTLYISVPPYGHISYSLEKGEVNLCISWQSRMGRTPQNNMILDEAKENIVHSLYKFVILEDEDESQLERVLDVLKEKRTRELSPELEEPLERFKELTIAAHTQ